MSGASSGISWRSILTSAASFLGAGAILIWEWVAVVVVAAIVVTAAIVGRVARHLARRALPGDPLRWANWFEWSALSWYAGLVAVGVAALWGATEFGDELETNLAGSAAIGTVFAIALVRTLDKLSDDDEWIDTAIGKDAEEMIQEAYVAQFAPTGPLPKYDEHDHETDAWISVCTSSAYGGWGSSGRTIRAHQLAATIQALPNQPTWV
jgi:hypothetical protein